MLRLFATVMVMQTTNILQQQQGQPPPVLPEAKRIDQPALVAWRSTSYRLRRLSSNSTVGRTISGCPGQWNGHRRRGHRKPPRCSPTFQPLQIKDHHEEGASPSPRPSSHFGKRLGEGSSGQHCSLSALCTACVTPSLGHGPPLVRR